MLPLAAYRDEAVLDREIDALFGHGWVCVGRSADVANTGDYLTTDLPTRGASARSVLVVRGDDGVVRCFDNVCVHRGARLVDDCGTQARLTCPYHAWTYRLDGSLIGAPHATAGSQAGERGLDVRAHRLGELRVEEWEGFVFVNQDDAAAPLAPRLAELHGVVGRYAMASYVPVRREVEIWDTNWKLLAENFMDAYHVFHVHRSSFGADGDSVDDTQVFPGTLDWTHHRVVEHAGPDLAAGRSDLEGDWRKTIVLAAVFPGLFMQLQPDWMWSLQLTPIGTAQVRVESRVAVPQAVLDAKPPVERDQWLTALFALIDQVNAEDRSIVESIRASVDRPQFERAPLVPLERNVYDFDRHVATRLTGG